MGAVRQQISAIAVEPAAKSKSRPHLLTALTIVTPLAVAVGLYLALVYAGTELTQGVVQRLFYVHVAAFSGAFVAFCGAVVGGILYLRTRNVKWDTLAVASIEVGLVLGVINLTLGMVWARPIWNTWWTWDPRLTSAAIMILTYSAYLMLRNSIENEEQRRRFASVYGILAISTVIITLVITRIRPDTIHPVVIGNAAQSAEGQFAMTDDMKMTLGVNSAIWSILVPWTLVWYRIRLENLAQRVQRLKASVMER